MATSAVAAKNAKRLKTESIPDPPIPVTVECAGLLVFYRASRFWEQTGDAAVDVDQGGWATGG
jgi:hypothetical protein